MRSLIKHSAIVAVLAWSVSTASAQLSLQSYSTNLGGGTVSGGAYTGEVAAGEPSGTPGSASFGSYIGLTAGNLASSAITVRTEDGSGSLISDNVSGYLLKVTPSGSYDTLEVKSDVASEFAFSAVFNGRYLVNVGGDPANYISTYNGGVIAWDEADQIVLKSDSTVSIDIVAVPVELPPNENGGTISGTIQSELVDPGGRVLQTQPDAGRSCGLRTNNNGTLELVAITETDASGAFEFTNLPAATYEFFIDVPGVPFDQAASTTIEVEEGQENANEFKIQAVVTESGIEVTIDEVLGFLEEEIVNLKVYPNPVTNQLTVDYRQLRRDQLYLEIRDLSGRLTLGTELNRDALEKTISLAGYQSGTYYLRILDQGSNDALTFKIIVE